MGQITIGFSTREDNPKFIEQIIKTCGVDVDIIQKINNGEKSLSKVYNESHCQKFTMKFWKKLKLT